MIENLSEQISQPEQLSQSRLRAILLVILLVIGIGYVYFALSPSHYSFFLKNHMGQDYQPIAGEAYGIRSDEWGMVTPYFQIAANNDFQRINQDSPYKEDLRFYYGLPLRDWALAFKPYMWGFFVLGDARGFSFYHFFMIAAFIAGYTIFLTQLRLPLLYALIIALTLFFSHHNQVWWSGNAPVFGLTVWIVIPFLTRWPLLIKLLATFLFSAAALFGLIYPPWQISMIYVFGILALAFRMDRFRPLNILVCFFGFAAGVGLCLYYLADIVPIVQNTVYPGDRSFSGGSSNLYYLWTLLFPHSLINSNYAPLVSYSNICLIGTVSTLLSLSLLVFGDYKRFFVMLRKNIVKVSILGVFLGLLFAWMYLAVPSSFGKFILFDQIESRRFLMASGTLLSCLVAILAVHNHWKLSWLRLAFYSFLVLVGSYSFKLVLGVPTAIDRFDVLVLAPVFIIILLKLFRLNSFKNQRQVSYLFASVALLYNVAAFGGFNPLQSSFDIFSAPSNPKVDTLKEFVNDYGLETLAMTRHTAAAASGLSIPTYNHVLLVPQLDFFRDLFPDLDDVTFNTIFNRYMHLSFHPSKQEPFLVQADYANIPLNSVSESIPVIANDTQPLTDSIDIRAVSNNWYTDNILVLKFQSPTPITVDDVSVRTPAKNSDVIEFGLRPILLFSKYFSVPDLTPNEAMMWELELDFSAIENSRVVYDDLDKVAINIADKEYRILFREQEVVKPLEDNTQKSYPMKGVIDFARYDVTSASLTLNGWAPVDDNSNVNLSEQLLRWFAYDTDLEVDLKELTTRSRPDVAEIYGEPQRSSGFSIVFDITNPPALDDDIEFCLYSRNKADGIYQLRVNADKLPIICDRP